MSRRSLSAVLLVGLLAAACGTTSPPTTAAPTGAAGSPAASQAPTGARLAAIKARGQLICGVNGGLQGFSFLEEGSGEWSGFDVDYCKAVAAALFGDPNAVQYRATSADDRGPALQTGEVDVLMRNTTWTVTRDAQWGLFGPTTFYDGQGLLVRADVGATSIADLAGATICVQSGTTTELNLADAMSEAGLEGNYEASVLGDIDQTYDTYETGACDAVTSDRSQLVSRRSSMENPDEHVLLEDVLSKEPLGPVVPFGDEQWFNVVKWTVFATIEAEELGITQANVGEMSSEDNPVIQRLLGTATDQTQGTLLGLENDWVVDVITAVGNYGEIFERNVGPSTPLALDRGLNNLWNNGGLMYAPPYR
jgi:general L-amino acid transport system substrate-binding protein